MCGRCRAAGRSFRHIVRPGTPIEAFPSGSLAISVTDTDTVSVTDTDTDTVSATDTDTDTDTVAVSDPAYSHLSASMGFKLAARRAG